INSDDFDLHLDYSSENFFIRNRNNEIINLSLRENQITDISFIKNFNKLAALNLDSNKISDITVLKYLKELNYLRLSTNQILDLTALEKLDSLKYLNVRNNNISNITPIKNLKLLENLYLWNNNIEDIEDLQNLKLLRDLDLGRNRISNIDVLTNLQNLSNLDIGQTNIFDLRPLKSIISKDIEIINQMDDFYEQRKGLFIYENHYTIPPIEVINQGNETILQYFEDADKYGLKTLNECKLIFVGDGGLGKTSLMKKIVGLPFSKEVTTHGINKKSWDEILNLNGEKIKVNLWDFGGQHIQHSLHQFFLSEKVIYILLLDPRNDTSAMYWLEQIDKLGKDSEVLIVYNWKDPKDRDSH
ncbi:hypothetical protein DBR27_16615, partial [Flavobacterium sp. HMWF030]